MTGDRTLFVAATVAAACIFAAAALLPGRTVITAYPNDLFIFLDGAWRIASGQVPNRDFHTALGPLAFGLPAAAFALAGHFGAVMPGTTALSLLILLPPLLHVAGSRLSTVIALPFALFLIAVTAMPINLGEKTTALSYAMFYNRTGWALYALLLVMHVVPRRPTAPLADAAAAAFLTLVMLYTKATYGIFALGFLGFQCLLREGRPWALPALAISAAAAGVIELFWGGTAAHWADLAQAAAVSGTPNVTRMTLGLLRHVPDFVFMALVLAPALRRGPKAADIAFFGYCAASGFWIFQQNAQPWGLLGLHAAAAVATEGLLRRFPATDRAAKGAPLLLLGMLLPTVVQGTLAAGAHARAALSDETPAVPLPRFDDVRVQFRKGEDTEFLALYLATLADGGRSLASVTPRPERVMVLDFSNPFSAGLGLPPPAGDYAWLHWKRNIDARHAPAAEALFGGVAHVMVPKRGINGEPLAELYGAAIARDFETLRDTEFWTLHRRRSDAPPPADDGKGRTDTTPRNRDALPRRREAVVPDRYLHRRPSRMSLRNVIHGDAGRSRWGSRTSWR